jgi:beta-galactosidase
MSVALTVDNRDKQAASTDVEVELLDSANTSVARLDKKVDFAAGDSVATFTLTTDKLTNLNLWSAETPYLYTVVVRQKDAQGKETSVFSTKYGFRNIAQVGQLIYVNGKQTYFKGTNTQDTHPLYGRSIDVPTMLKDITMMKQANMNIIRTSHYPRQPKMYAMFDHYGLYIMDEADVECHKNWSDGASMTNDPTWKAQYVDRTVRMVLRDRNHPSVTFWSLGNESSNGICFTASYAATRALDPRLIHYEGATGSNNTDLYSNMYPDLGSVANHVAGNTGGKPYFMCEYAHAMGNAVGNLKEYWDLIEGSQAGIGGCIWDWVDQSIYNPADIKKGNFTKNGMNYYMSGYDFPGPHQDNFENNGIITADRAWTSKLTEVKHVYQYVKFVGFSAVTKSLTLKNKYDFTNLNKFYLTYTVLRDGDEVETGRVDLPSTAPDASCQVTVPFTTSFVADDAEYMITFRVKMKDATCWADADYCVADNQYTLRQRAATLPAVQGDAQTLTLTKNTTGATLTNGKMTMTFDAQGLLTQWLCNDNAVLAAGSKGPVYSNFRWIDNDRFGGKDNGSSDFSLDSVALNADHTACTVVTSAGGTKCPYTLTYTIYGTGVVDLAATFSPATSDLRRLGLAMTFPAGYENVEYYAKGPWANYWDRQTGSYLGRYTTTVDDMFEPISHPQTMGDRQALRELLLTNTVTGDKLKIETEGQVSFSLLHYDENTFATTKLHPWDLTHISTVNAHFDYLQRGIGNGSCGPSTIDAYKCPDSGSYSYKLRFTPIKKGEDTAVKGPVSQAMQCHISYDSQSDAVVCRGTFDAGTRFVLTNLGGVRLASARTAAAGDAQVTLSLKGQPHGAYLVRVAAKDGVRNHKLVK